MNRDQKKVVLFVPFWRQDNHVGTYRVGRFLRWLTEEGYAIVLIRAGRLDGHREEPWGEEITVKDPLGFYPEPMLGSAHVSIRKPNKLRRSVAVWVFNPDPTIIWARIAARHPLVIQATQGAEFILSSNPPESAHVGAWLLSRRTGVPHIVDMRDGWLDEPLRPLLRTSALRRWREGRLETAILHEAKAIQVTSDAWKTLLCERYPDLSHRVGVLTNGYPQSVGEPESCGRRNSDDPPILVHAGRFMDSDPRRKPTLLLEPLLRELSVHKSAGVVQLLGLLSTNDLALVTPFIPRFEAIGWRLECPGNLPRVKLLEVLSHADGLLLLSITPAQIPCKLFEYMPTGKPLFVVAHRDSAVWNICSSLPQAVLIESAPGDADSAMASRPEPWYMNRDFVIPPQFSEESLGKVFKRIALGK